MPLLCKPSRKRKGPSSSAGERVTITLGLGSCTLPAHGPVSFKPVQFYCRCIRCMPKLNGSSYIYHLSVCYVNQSHICSVLFGIFSRPPFTKRGPVFFGYPQKIEGSYGCENSMYIPIRRTPYLFSWGVVVPHTKIFCCCQEGNRNHTFCRQQNPLPLFRWIHSVDHGHSLRSVRSMQYSSFA